MLGTHRPPAAEKGVVHEGYGGWTWARFVTKFEADPDGTYKNRYTRWGWKRIQHRLVQRQLQYVKAKADPQMSCVPTQLNLDPIQGYPEKNGVHHPNDYGHRFYTQVLSQLLVDSEILATSREK